MGAAEAVEQDAGARQERCCPQCDNPPGARLETYARDHWRVVECSGCGFVFLANPPDVSALVDEYAWEKTFSAEKTRRKSSPFYRLDSATRRWRMSFKADEGRYYSRLFGGSGRILDVGCGNGERIPEPYIPFGIEISRGLHAVADQAMKLRGGYCVHSPARQGFAGFDAGFFAGILMRSYLEHEVEPRAVLHQARRALKAGGGIYVKVPNYGSVNRRLMGARWCGFRYPDHVNYFDITSLRAMAAAEHYEMKLLNPLNVAIDDNIHALLTPKP